MTAWPLSGHGCIAATHLTFGASTNGVEDSNHTRQLRLESALARDRMVTSPSGPSI